MPDMACHLPDSEPFFPVFGTLPLGTLALPLFFARFFGECEPFCRESAALSRNQAICDRQGRLLQTIHHRQAGYLQGVILRITVFLFFMDSNSRAHLPPGRVGVGNVIPRITRAGLPCAGSSPVRTAINIENQCFCII